MEQEQITLALYYLLTYFFEEKVDMTTVPHMIHQLVEGAPCGTAVLLDTRDAAMPANLGFAAVAFSLITAIAPCMRWWRERTQEFPIVGYTARLLRHLQRGSRTQRALRREWDHGFIALPRAVRTFMGNTAEFFEYTASVARRLQLNYKLRDALCGRNGTPTPTATLLIAMARAMFNGIDPLRITGQHTVNNQERGRTSAKDVAHTDRLSAVTKTIDAVRKYLWMELGALRGKLAELHQITLVDEWWVNRGDFDERPYVAMIKTKIAAVKERIRQLELAVTAWDCTHAFQVEGIFGNMITALRTMFPFWLCEQHERLTLKMFEANPTAKRPVIVMGHFWSVAFASVLLELGVNAHVLLTHIKMKDNIFVDYREGAAKSSAGDALMLRCEQLRHLLHAIKTHAHVGHHYQLSELERLAITQLEWYLAMAPGGTDMRRFNPPPELKNKRKRDDGDDGDDNH